MKYIVVREGKAFKIARLRIGQPNGYEVVAVCKSEPLAQELCRALDE